MPSLITGSAVSTFAGTPLAFRRHREREREREREGERELYSETMSMTGASRARPGDRPCVPFVGRTNPGR